MSKVFNEKVVEIPEEGGVRKRRRRVEGRRYPSCTIKRRIASVAATAKGGGHCQ
jgi:hypothetical protein